MRIAELTARQPLLRAGVAAVLLSVAACTGPPPRPPAPAPLAAAIDQVGKSPVPRPDNLEDVPNATPQRSPRLEEELRRALPPGLRVVRTNSAVEPALSARHYEIGALVTDGTGYGTILVTFDSPPITSGEPGCLKPDRQHCRILPRPNGDTVSMADRSGDAERRAITAERFRPDQKLALTVRSLDGADERPSRFWRGGPRLGRVPLDADQVTALSDHPGFTPD
ncbi:hypothetical protein [Crossiella sp. NPDC003009]